MVLDGIDTYDLAKLVKKYMREGWQPLGGVVCSDSGRLYLQAMVQYEGIVEIEDDNWQEECH